MKKRKKRGIGERQASVVMKEYNKGNLRSRSGQTVRKPSQAKAIAMSEKRAAEKRGVSKRTWKGRTRTRPHLKKRKH